MGEEGALSSCKLLRHFTHERERSGGLGIVGNEQCLQEQLVPQYGHAVHTVQEKKKYEAVKQLSRCSQVVFYVINNNYQLEINTFFEKLAVR